MTLSTSACVSMPGGPSASVEQTISGPSAKRRGSSASARARVTVSFELGLTTWIRARRRFIGLTAAARGSDADRTTASRARQTGSAMRTRMEE